MNKSLKMNMTNISSTAVSSQSNYSDYYDYHFLGRIFLLAGWSGVSLHAKIYTGLFPGLVVISIIGNTLAIHSLLRKKMRRKRSSILFLNLALADCLVTIFPMAGN